MRVNYLQLHITILFTIYLLYFDMFNDKSHKNVA